MICNSRILSQGLFHAAIAQSGLALSPWALAQEPRARAFELGRELGLDTNNTAELMGLDPILIYAACSMNCIVRHVER